MVPDSPLGVNRQYGQLPAGLPYVWIQNDWDHEVNLEDLCEVVRCMGQDGYKDTAVGSIIQIDNERDQVFPSPAERLAKIAEIRTYRPDLLIVSTPSRPQDRSSDIAQEWYAKELEACNFIGWHSAVYEDPGLAVDLGVTPKNTIILEVQANPTIHGDIDKIPGWMAKAAAHGFKGIYAWGDNPTKANINDYPALLQEIADISQQGVPMPPEPNAPVTLVQKWVQDHQATVLIPERYDASGEYSTTLVLVGDADGHTKDPITLTYVKATGALYEFNFPPPTVA